MATTNLPIATMNTKNATGQKHYLFLDSESAIRKYPPRKRLAFNGT